MEVAQGLVEGEAMIIERIWKDPKTTVLGLSPSSSGKA